MNNSTRSELFSILDLVWCWAPMQATTLSGKSTFLLIVDYVFGGSTYAGTTDIIENVGPTIYTSLLFLAKKSLSFAETALMPILFGNAMILTRKLKKSD